MNTHFALFFSWIHAQKSEVNIHTGLNDLQEKYKFTFSNYTTSCVSNTFSYQTFQVQVVVNWCSQTASLELSESRVQHSTAHCWTASKAGEVKEKILSDFGEIQRVSGSCV